MRRPSWYALMIVAAVGLGDRGATGLCARVSRVGWFGILIIGLIIILVPQLAEWDADSPAWSVTLLRRQYEQTFDGTMENRLARWVERVERNKWRHIARTIGIAIMLIDLNMFIVHQL